MSISLGGHTFDTLDQGVRFLHTLVPEPQTYRQNYMVGPPHIQRLDPKPNGSRCRLDCKPCNDWFAKPNNPNEWPHEEWLDEECRKRRFYRLAWAAAMYTILTGEDVLHNPDLLLRVSAYYRPNERSAFDAKARKDQKMRARSMFKHAQFRNLFSHYTVSVLEKLGIDPTEHLMKSMHRLDELALGSSAGGEELLKDDKYKLDALRLHMLVAGVDLTLPEDRPKIPSGGRDAFVDADYTVEFEPPPVRAELPTNGKEAA